MSSSSSCTVVQSQFHSASEEPLVATTGPPCLPAGSIVPLVAIIRLGWVGPRIEAW